MSKGTIVDIIFIMIFLVIFAVVLIFSYYIYNQFIGKGLDDDILLKGKNALLIFNYGFLIIVLGAGGASIAGAFMLDSHPIFFIFTTFMFLIFIIIGVVLTNLFDQIITNELISTTAGDFNIIIAVLRNIPLLMTVWGILLSIVLYGKLKGGSSYGV
jgi:low temperature requirement protein LtrA